ncbi:hypothetical protein PMAYCL1PPCAC_18048 [Pristionchus mayeri]|uniref:F-box domain-containing protein n=1 Tax=Pristionchus mayeri TaxID=1317129 RepID=A0AAN5CNS7_9BILA|nr:hypothetical protein PMAYCL1PPCAC_18048 [Pristionchus mayeri]
MERSALPIELLVHIFNFTTPKDLSNIQLTSKQFNSIVENHRMPTIKLTQLVIEGRPKGHIFHLQSEDQKSSKWGICDGMCAEHRHRFDLRRENSHYIFQGEVQEISSPSSKLLSYLELLMKHCEVRDVCIYSVVINESMLDCLEFLLDKKIVEKISFKNVDFQVENADRLRRFFLDLGKKCMRFNRIHNMERLSPVFDDLFYRWAAFNGCKEIVITAERGKGREERSFISLPPSAVDVLSSFSTLFLPAVAIEPSDLRRLVEIILERQQTGFDYRFHFDTRGIDWSIFQSSNEYPNTQTWMRIWFDDRSITLWRGEIQAELYTRNSEVIVLFKGRSR